jgi:heavy metal translocating P-type ATPase
VNDRAGVTTRRILAATLTGLAAGTAAALAGRSDLASAAWAATTAIALVPLTLATIRDLARGNAGVDLIALLAMGGALLLGQYLPGAVIALMLSGGQALETYAGARARRELAALVERAPRVVHRYLGDQLVTADINDVRPGDVLVVKSGEVVPVDGAVVGATAVLDESALTGEAIPQERPEHDRVTSGAVNAASAPFTMRALATAADSTYAGIVRLVQEAQAAKAPLDRLADRYALLFLPITLGVAAIAWLWSGDPVRALAVLVVATPCPLILAAPVAIVAGISRAARHGIIIKGGGALETLARATELVLDKTGTITAGSPIVTDIETFDGANPDDVLRFAASLDQASTHVIAVPIVRAARERRLPLTFPSDVVENLGSGIEGRVNGTAVRMGKADWVMTGSAKPAQVRRIRRRTLLEGSAAVFVAIDGRPAGALVLEDPVRPDAPLTLRTLRSAGFAHITMLTGDHVDLAETVGAALGVDRVLAERSPEEKVDAVRMTKADGVTVMVGDGINDAAALAAADVGVAMGARGATASSDAADIVLVVDRLDRLTEGIRIARRSRGIAIQSIVAGMAMSGAGMVFAAAGLLAPVAGALVQEAIDIAVMLNALRALGDSRGSRRSDAGAVQVSQQFRDEHRKMLPEVRRIRQVADRLDELEPAAARAELDRIRRFLVDELLPHNREEDARVYPVVAGLIGGHDPTATMSRAHQEIAHLARIFGRLLEELAADEAPGADDVRELRRVLYGLHATLGLHFAQEEESYLALIDDRLQPAMRR